MSTKPSNNRRQPAAQEAAAEPQIEEQKAVAETPVVEAPEPVEVVEEPVVEPEPEATIQPTQHVQSREEEALLVSSLVGAARDLFGVNPEVVVGALAHAEIEDKATVSQVKQAINAYLQLPI